MLAQACPYSLVGISEKRFPIPSTRSSNMSHSESTDSFDLVTEEDALAAQEAYLRTQMAELQDCITKLSRRQRPLCLRVPRARGGSGHADGRVLQSRKGPPGRWEGKAKLRQVPDVPGFPSIPHSIAKLGDGAPTASPAKDSVFWFHLKVDQEQFAWAFKDGSPMKRIAALLFGTLLLCKLLAKKQSDSSSRVRLPVGSDNQANVNLLSKKPYTATILMELVLQLHK